MRHHIINVCFAAEREQSVHKLVEILWDEFLRRHIVHGKRSLIERCTPAIICDWLPRHIVHGKRPIANHHTECDEHGQIAAGQYRHRPTSLQRTSVVEKQ